MKMRAWPFTFKALSTFNICLATVATPVLVRILIDGVIPSKDMQAITITLSILGLTEVFNILLQYSLNLQLDQEESAALMETRQQVIADIYQNHKFQVDQNKFMDFWGTDLQRYVYQAVKSPWFRIKDGIMILLLSLICLNISYLAGVAVLVIFGLSLGTIYLAQKQQAKILPKTYSLKEQERSFLGEALSKFHDIQDQNLWANHSGRVTEILEELKATKVTQLGLRAREQRQNSFLRVFMVFGILAVGGVLFAQDKLSMGSLWALMITIYRINGPIQSYCRWMLSLKTESILKDRVERMRELLVSPVFEKPSYFNKLSKVLDEVVNSRGRVLVIASDSSKLSEMKDVVRYWKSRSSKRDEIHLLKETDPEVPEKVSIRFIDRVSRVNANLTFALSSDLEDARFDGVHKL